MAYVTSNQAFQAIDGSPERPGDAPEAGEANRRLAWLVAASRTSAKNPYHFLLILRFALANILGFALLATAYLHGMVDPILVADRTYLSVVIFAVFLVGLVYCAWRIVRVSRELNQVHAFNPLVPSRAADYLAKLRGCDGDGRSILAGALRLKISHSISPVRHIAGSLVLLGLIGTVIGFIIALSGVDPANASNIDSVGPMVSTLISGMSTALYTTLVGSVLNVWLMINYQILAGGTVKLITKIQEFGEQHAGD